MEVLVAKILIIFGLLLLTLFAALLPLFCLRLTTHRKKKSQHKKNAGSHFGFCHNFCAGGEPNSTAGDVKPPLRNGSVLTSNSEICRTKSQKKTLISILNCFAGGIFLGTSFIDLLPEIRECFEPFDIRWPDFTNSFTSIRNGTSADDGPEPLPIAEIIVVLGLYFILCVEQGAHSLNHWRMKRKRATHDTMALRHLNKHDFSVEEGVLPPSSPPLSDDSDRKPRHDHTGIRSLMLVATLSVHSLLEGIAIGLQDSVGSVVAIFIAVLLHKSLMAFSMGGNLVHGNQCVKKIVAAAIIFALASPCGIAMGLIIKTTGGDNSGTQLVTAILQAIATGAFLYITFFEVLVKEFEGHGNRLAKVLSLFAGYGAVFATFLFAKHS